MSILKYQHVCPVICCARSDKLHVLARTDYLLAFSQNHFTTVLDLRKKSSLFGYSSAKTKDRHS